MPIDIEAPGGSAADLTAALRALVDRPFYGAKVKKASDQTPANYSSGSVVAWDSEIEDVGGWHDNVTNNSRLTVPSGLGITRVRLFANFKLGALLTNSRYYIKFTKDGGDLDYVHEHSIPAITAVTDTEVATITMPVAATAGSYFEVFLLIGGGDSSITVKAASVFGIEATHFA